MIDCLPCLLKTKHLLYKRKKPPTQEKIKTLGKFQEYTTGTTFEPKIRKKSDDNDGGKLDIMKSQATELKHYRMNSRNERWMMLLKAIEAEYYSIEN